MRYLRCKAGATKCQYKQNSDLGVIVCGKTLVLDAVKKTETPKDSYGNDCPFFKPFEVI